MLIGVKKDNEVVLEHKITPRVIETSKDGTTGDITLTKRIEQGAMVELQLSLPQDIHLGSVGSPIVTLVGVDQGTSPEAEDNVLQDEVASEHLDDKEPPRQQTSATFHIVGKQQAKISAGLTSEACFPRVELILDCSGREKEPRFQSDRGCVISGEEGGQTEAPPSTVSFGIKAEDSEEGEEAQQAEGELVKPNKHRARHASKYATGHCLHCSLFLYVTAICVLGLYFNHLLTPTTFISFFCLFVCFLLHVNACLWGDPFLLFFISFFVKGIWNTEEAD